MEKVASIKEYKVEKQYQQFGSVAFDLSKDNQIIVKEKRNYAKRLQLGYMRLLSNYKG